MQMHAFRIMKADKLVGRDNKDKTMKSYLRFFHARKNKIKMALP